MAKRRNFVAKWRFYARHSEKDGQSSSSAESFLFRSVSKFRKVRTARTKVYDALNTHPISGAL